jgi:spore coat polysaccharide biosynthesis protein SpsF
MIRTDNPNPPILIRCDGGHAIGLGHVVRCLAIADELRLRGADVRFAVRREASAFELIDRHGFDCLGASIHPGCSEEDWLRRCVESVEAGALILDLRPPISRESVRHLRQSGLLIATIDDRSDQRLEADLAFYPPVDQVHELDWSGFTGRRFVGWEWIPLRRQFAVRVVRPRPAQPNLVVAMGGSDPRKLTGGTVAVLLNVETVFHAHLVLGPGFKDSEAVHQLVSQRPDRFTIHCDPPSMSALLNRADLALVAFGMTAYECAALRVPTLCLCLTSDHARSAEAFSRAGLGLSLGEADAAWPDRLSESVTRVLAGSAGRHRFTPNHAIDGRGAVRIAETLLRNLADARSEDNSSRTSLSLAQ